MENLKEKLPIMIAIIIVILLLIGAYYLLFIQKNIYYTQIDNTKIEQISSTDEMRYQYSLTAYDKNGKGKEIEFKTTRQLRDGAYLELEVMTTRGVISWKEIKDEELPDEVKTKMNVK